MDAGKFNIKETATLTCILSEYKINFVKGHSQTTDSLEGVAESVRKYALEEGGMNRKRKKKRGGGGLRKGRSL